MGRVHGGTWCAIAIVSFVGAATGRAADPPPAATIVAAGRGAPYLYLRDGQKVLTNYAGDVPTGGVKPLSLASADFDEDGMPDLASGYAASDGTGVITIHRGNVDALWPYGKALRNGEPPAFHPDARSFRLPEAPDFLGAGDFDADGHWDLVAASLGSTTLYLLRGDGHGGFAAPEAIAIPGAVTAFTTGEIDRVDGLTDIAVGVTSVNGPQVVVFESPRGALRDKPEVFTMATAVTALAMMPLDDDGFNDLAVGAGNRLISIHGRDRKLSHPQTIRDGVPAAEITSQTLPFQVRGLTAGHFTSAITDLAALGDDGKVHFLERPDADYQAAVGELTRTVAGPKDLPPTGRKGTRDRQSLPQKPTAKELVLRTEVALPSMQNGARLITARMSLTKADDVVVTGGGSQLHVLSRQPGTRSMRLAASLDASTGAPAAALPMRLHPSALHGLVVLHQGQTEPSVVLPRVANSYVVTNTQDSGPSQFNSYSTAIPGSLRTAISNAANASGTSTITFDIPVSDPNYNANAGTFTIVPLTNLAACGAASGGLELPCVGFPELPAGLILDGYTQPGGTANGITKPPASPNTSSHGDNAVIKIVISGAQAGDGENGFQVYNGTTTVRGFAINGFANYQVIDQGQHSNGGDGMEIDSGGNIIEGNFLGTDYSGTQVLANYIGVGWFDGPNIIGGTTPQARNLASGNPFGGIAGVAISDPNTFFVQGNYVGTDHTGTVGLGGGGYYDSGVATVGGGTTAGAGNLFSGVVSNSGMGYSYGPMNTFDPNSNLLQGNLIGTDPTGTFAVPNSAGVGIEQADQNLIGGTTPAARNIISGNSGDGVQLFDASSVNMVQGNYIGVDISGIRPLVNGGNGIDHSLLNGSANAAGTIIGGESAGAGNVIGGNGANGILLGGYAVTNIETSLNNMGAMVLGNLIGTDSTGAAAMPNGNVGIEIIQNGANFTIGGTDTPAGNVIAFNKAEGVRVDPGFEGAEFVSSNGPNAVVGNAIFSNGAAGVHLASGADNRVSLNSIFSNAGLGIQLDGVTPPNSCQANTSGPNLLQNAPVLTPSNGSTVLISATATDPNGNTSAFSNCAAMAGSGGTVDIVGMLNSLPNNAYSIEFFQNATCDPSGSGQGKTFLKSIPVTTNASCVATFNSTINATQADLSLAMGYNGNLYSTYVNPGETFPFMATVTNTGAGSAASVSFSDTLPASVTLVSASTTQGTCANTGNALTCSLGTLASGATAVVSISLTVINVGTITDTASVSSPTSDPNLSNNSATLTLNSNYPLPTIDHFSPASGVAGAGDLAVQVAGNDFISSTTTVFVNNTQLSYTVGANQTCGSVFQPSVCQVLNVTIPASLTASPTTLTITVTNPTPGGGSYPLPFVIYPNPGTVTQFLLSGIPNPALQNTAYNMTVTAENSTGQVVPGYRGIVNLDGPYNTSVTFNPPSPYQFTAADNGVHTFSTTLLIPGSTTTTVTDAGTPGIAGSLTVLVNPLLGPPAQLSPGETPDNTPIGFLFPQPLTVTVEDASLNPLPGITVTFTAVTLNGSAASGTFSNGQSSIQLVTDANGTVNATITANQTAGQFQVNATVGQLITQFFPTSTTKVPAHITIFTGNPQSGPIDTQFSGAIAVVVTDANGVAVPEVPVMFSAPTTGASINLPVTVGVTERSVDPRPGEAFLDPIGVSNGIAGSYLVTATVGSLSVNFNFTNTPTPSTVASLAVVSGTPQSTLLNTQFATQLVVIPEDANNNCLAQVPVTFTVPASGPSATLSATTVKSDPVTCQVAVTATANGTKGGPYNVTATAGGQTATFVLTNYAGLLDSLTTTHGTPQSTSVGTGFTAPLRVLLLDPNGSPINGQSITFTAPAVGPSATLSAPTVYTDPTGTAQITASANDTQGTYTVTATFTPATGNPLTANFTLTNLPPGVGGVTATGGTPQSAQIGTQFATALSATVSNSVGSPMSGVTVTFSVPGSGASAVLSSQTAVTNAQGIASVTATANGTVGSYSVGVSVGSFSSSFSLTNTAGPPASLTPTGTPQATQIGQAFSEPLQVTARDSGGNPVSGVSISFLAPGSGASAALSAASATTNASGIASVTATANGAAGTYMVSAKAGSLSAAFSLTNSNLSPCDVNQDGLTNVLDLQKMVNEALGKGTAGNDLNGDGKVNVVDIQIVIDAVLGLGCSAV